MKSTDFNKNGEAEFKKDYVRGIRHMNERKEIPDYSGIKEEDIVDDADELVMEETVADSIEDNEKRSSKGLAWLIGIAAVFAICIMVVGLLSHDGSPLSSRDGGRGAKVATLSSAAPESESVELVYITADQPSSAGAKAVKAGNNLKQGIASAASAVKASKSGSAYDDRIEREAREVIHGDFGNNPSRKAALGADYAAVQERVNEILNGNN